MSVAILHTWFHQRMFKPFKYWADYTDNELTEWCWGLNEDIDFSLTIPETPENNVKTKLRVFTPLMRKNLKEMTKTMSDERRKSPIELTQLSSPTKEELLRRLSLSPHSEGNLTPRRSPTSPCIMRRLSLDNIRPLISPKTRRKS